MQEFARVAETAEAGLFVVFAYVGGEVCNCYCADVCGGFDGTDGAGGGVGVLGDVGLVARCAFVCAIARCLILRFCRASTGRS